MPVLMGKLDTSVNGPEGLPPFDGDAWDRVDWRRHEEQVRRLRGRIFKAVQDGDWPLARSLQKLTAPRGVLSYPRFNREELEGRFLGLMAYLDPKGKGNNSMPGKQRPCSGV
jgi:N-terminal domain of reverse transcriptase